MNIEWVPNEQQRWWIEITVSIIGTIIFPLFIWFATWFFGASRAERNKQQKENQSNLNYLKSVCYYTIANLVSIYTLAKKKEVLLRNIQTNSVDDKILLFSHITFQDVYSQIESEKYANFAHSSQSFILNILQVKRSLVDMFETITLINQTNNELKKDEDIPFFIMAFQKNIPCLIGKIALAIYKLEQLIKDIDKVSKELKLTNLVDIQLTDAEKQQIEHSREDLKQFFNSKGSV